MAIRYGLGTAALTLALGQLPTGQAQTPQMQQTAQCVLSAIKDTRSHVAVQLIQRACNDLVVQTGHLYDKQRAYDQCLIDQLSGAQSDAAALQVQGACRTANPL